jgi:hypothetical protein
MPVPTLSMLQRSQARIDRDKSSGDNQAHTDVNIATPPDRHFR